jgi:hypothetical protein
VIRELRAKGYAIEQGWRTIDSAERPEDAAIQILLYSYDEGVCIGIWDLNTDFRHEPGGWPLKPTHWRPLPAAPGGSDGNT